MTCNPNVILRRLWLAIVLITGVLGPQQASAATDEGCVGEAYRAFDFWIGNWEVHLRDGRRAGTNLIEAAADGCLLREFWTGTSGGEGFSLNFYEPAADRWRQVWVSAGSLIEITGGPEAESMVLTGEISYRRTGDVRPFRGRWTPLTDGRVRQLFEEYQEGEGWQSWFEGIYSKVLE